jgi:hypothetical protein
LAFAWRRLLYKLFVALSDCPQIYGPLLEFGVYEGRYLLLMRHARALREQTLGIDTFELSHPQTVWDHAAAMFGPEHEVNLFKARTSNMTARDILRLIGGKRPRFISIDGDHPPRGVEHDLKLAARILAPRGCIAVDDVGNPNAIGVAEGFFRLFLRPWCSLQLFRWCQNKMFVCKRRDIEFYRELFFRSVGDNPDLEVTKEFERRRGNGPLWVDQALPRGTVLTLV